MMVRDPGMEEVMRKDLGAIPGLGEKPMFGGLCFLSHGNMICAIREGRGMYRVGRPHEAAALDIPGSERMVHGGHAYPGWIWLSGDSLSDDKIRARLTGWAMKTVRALPPKE
ncbi:hypothetical protein RGQ15_06080 [Paracoccus sp. MBLB3053]|uniref:TfoX N-terminal domain-containing protein n=1 Tax=Paracoccus aurantius TaxID=3073814 RepID=A0ABU2HQ16_9RHOB|nr:hypothetical protein [Paracoccus sp. MBLB3053]MDS9467140.1 hypothetical protein [Paracoccus sp. MBLB3053]